MRWSLSLYFNTVSIQCTVVCVCDAWNLFTHACIQCAGGNCKDIVVATFQWDEEWSPLKNYKSAQIAIAKILWDQLRAFKDIIILAIRKFQEGMLLLEMFKEQIILILIENHPLARELAKQAAKAGLFGIGYRYATKAVLSRVSLRSASKLMKFSGPVSLGADMLQCGLEIAGFKKTGKAIDVAGNIARGAFLVGSIAGPPGAAVGALGGFVFWIIQDAAAEKQKQKSLTCEQKSLTCEQKSLTHEQKSLTSEQKTLTCEQKSLTCEQKSLTCEQSR